MSVWPPPETPLSQADDVQAEEHNGGSTDESHHDIPVDGGSQQDFMNNDDYYFVDADGNVAPEGFQHVSDSNRDESMDTSKLQEMGLVNVGSPERNIPLPGNNSSTSSSDSHRDSFFNSFGFEIETSTDLKPSVPHHPNPNAMIAAVEVDAHYPQHESVTDPLPRGLPTSRDRSLVTSILKQVGNAELSSSPALSSTLDAQATEPGLGNSAVRGLAAPQVPPEILEQATTTVSSSSSVADVLRSYSKREEQTSHLIQSAAYQDGQLALTGGQGTSALSSSSSISSDLIGGHNTLNYIDKMRDLQIEQRIPLVDVLDVWEERFLALPFNTSDADKDETDDSHTLLHQHHHRSRSGGYHDRCTTPSAARVALEAEEAGMDVEAYLASTKAPATPIPPSTPSKNDPHTPRHHRTPSHKRGLSTSLQSPSSSSSCTSSSSSGNSTNNASGTNTNIPPPPQYRVFRKVRLGWVRLPRDRLAALMLGLNPNAESKSKSTVGDNSSSSSGGNNPNGSDSTRSSEGNPTDEKSLPQWAATTGSTDWSSLINATLKAELEYYRNKPTVRQLVDAQERVTQLEAENAALREALARRERRDAEREEIHKMQLLAASVSVASAQTTSSSSSSSSSRRPSPATLSTTPSSSNTPLISSTTAPSGPPSLSRLPSRAGSAHASLSHMATIAAANGVAGSTVASAAAIISREPPTPRGGGAKSIPRTVIPPPATAPGTLSKARLVALATSNLDDERRVLAQELVVCQEANLSLINALEDMRLRGETLQRMSDDALVRELEVETECRERVIHQGKALTRIIDDLEELMSTSAKAVGSFGALLGARSETTMTAQSSIERDLSGLIEQSVVARGASATLKEQCEEAGEMVNQFAQDKNKWEMMRNEVEKMWKQREQLEREERHRMQIARQLSGKARNTLGHTGSINASTSTGTSTSPLSGIILELDSMDSSIDPEYVANPSTFLRKGLPSLLPSATSSSSSSMLNTSPTLTSTSSIDTAISPATASTGTTTDLTSSLSSSSSSSSSSSLSTSTSSSFDRSPLDRSINRLSSALSMGLNGFGEAESSFDVKAKEWSTMHHTVSRAHYSLTTSLANFQAATSVLATQYASLLSRAKEMNTQVLSIISECERTAAQRINQLQEEEEKRVTEMEQLAMDISHKFHGAVMSSAAAVSVATTTPSTATALPGTPTARALSGAAGLRTTASMLGSTSSNINPSSTSTLSATQLRTPTKTPNKPTTSSSVSKQKAMTSTTPRPATATPTSTRSVTTPSASSSSSSSSSSLSNASVPPTAMTASQLESARQAEVASLRTMTDILRAQDARHRVRLGELERSCARLRTEAQQAKEGQKSLREEVVRLRDLVSQHQRSLEEWRVKGDMWGQVQSDYEKDRLDKHNEIVILNKQLHDVATRCAEAEAIKEQVDIERRGEKQLIELRKIALQKEEERVTETQTAVENLRIRLLAESRQAQIQLENGHDALRRCNETMKTTIILLANELFRCVQEADDLSVDIIKSNKNNKARIKSLRKLVNDLKNECAVLTSDDIRAVELGLKNSTLFNTTNNNNTNGNTDASSSSLNESYVGDEDCDLSRITSSHDEGKGGNINTNTNTNNGDGSESPLVQYEEGDLGNDTMQLDGGTTQQYQLSSSSGQQGGQVVRVTISLADALRKLSKAQLALQHYENACSKAEEQLDVLRLSQKRQADELAKQRDNILMQLETCDGQLQILAETLDMRARHEQIERLTGRVPMVFDAATQTAKPQRSKAKEDWKD